MLQVGFLYKIIQDGFWMCAAFRLIIAVYCYAVLRVVQALPTFRKSPQHDISEGQKPDK